MPRRERIFWRRVGFLGAVLLLVVSLGLCVSRQPKTPANKPQELQIVIHFPPGLKIEGKSSKEFEVITSRPMKNGERPEQWFQILKNSNDDFLSLILVEHDPNPKSLSAYAPDSNK